MVAMVISQHEPPAAPAVERRLAVQDEQMDPPVQASTARLISTILMLSTNVSQLSVKFNELPDRVAIAVRQALAEQNAPPPPPPRSITIDRALMVAIIVVLLVFACR